jgi:hypothetical protein
MKYLGKIWLRIAIAAIAGLFVAGLTKMTYPCSPSIVQFGESVDQCVSFEKSIMHPKDLLANRQDSLVDFTKTLLITSLFVFIILSILVLARTKTIKPLK